MNIDHLDLFQQFCKYERMTGGPDPHMRAVEAMCAGADPREQMWRIHCYMSVYNVPSAEAIWRNWPVEKFLAADMEITDWLEEHWKGLRLRRERKTCLRPEWLNECLSGIAETLTVLPTLEDKHFRAAWDFALSLPRVGRYAATKLTELWFRRHFISFGHKDISSRGGWSPRTTLKMVYPEANHNPYNDTPESVEQADMLALRLFEETKQPSWFEFEVMLCEYKACFLTGRQYPGRSLDSELSYELAIRDYWKLPGVTNHMAVRAHMHPRWALGEFSGWKGPRREPAKVLQLYGYMWSDSLYKYPTDFANPEKKDGTQVDQVS